ncbi:hypothetical protein Cfor_09859 [Coptotermes formosanus]|jgi:hypothetical protein|uniref:DUF4200 domain-containing protein n=1 Tax=Coptotermes formosanus TaxID=36987 RepID=A0A6L2PTD5_COPFO|nr:hypothetical protein Cfor_09859 [Coptotermes formosanus]
MASGIEPYAVGAKKKRDADRKLGLTSKVKRPSLQECNFRRLHAGRAVHYFTAGTGVDKGTMRDVNAEPSPFWFPPDRGEVSYRLLTKVWCKLRREEEARYDAITRPNYRSRQRMDILKRLYIPDEEVECKQPGLLDIDPQYFKILEGRPIKEKLNLRRYVEEVRETLKTKLKVGYQLDEAMNIGEKFQEEEKRLNNTEALYEVFADSFSEFLEEDHESTMKLLHDAQIETDKSTNMSNQLKKLEKQLEGVKCEVSILEENWRNCKMLQKFLYMASPMDWRKKHDYIHRTGHNSVLLVSEMSTLFGRYRLLSPEPEVSLDKLLDLFLTDIKTGEEPLLYFAKPCELLQVFQNMELQNLNCLLHSGDLTDPIQTVQQGLTDAQEQFETQRAYTADKINDLETAITWEEDRIRSLKDKARKLLYELFKDQVMGESAVRLHVFVEDVYEACTGRKDSNRGLMEMMRAIETKMESLLLSLDYLPSGIVRVAETRVYEEEARVKKEAELAEVRMKMLEKLTWRLRRALEPPAYSCGKPLKPRSEPPPVRKKKPKSEKPLTDEEKDFLDFFTDYCHHVDNARDYLALKRGHDFVQK